MDRLIVREMASARGLDPGRASVVAELVTSWDRHYGGNERRERYYRGDVAVKDLGVSVTPQMMRRLRPHVDWAAKCVNWWADRVQFEGYRCPDEDAKARLDEVCRLNDMDNLVRKVTLSALKNPPAFLSVTGGDAGRGEPDVIVSGYPATAASALYSDALKRISAGLVVVDTAWNASHTRRRPTLAYVLTDGESWTLRSTGAGWVAEVAEHGMGRVPMEPVVYHGTLERPFGRSRITKTVRDLVDDAQREMANMAATAAFAAAPQKYFLGADKAAAEKLADSPFGAFIGSIFTATPNRNGNTPQFGQLAQLTMQPHSDYMHLLASMFSDATGVPMSSLGFSTTNPSSADAIIASKEDAIVDIAGFVSSLSRSMEAVAWMALAAQDGTGYAEATRAYDVSATFADPATPSPVSMSAAVQQRVAAFPWMADSDVPLRDLGYDEDTIRELESDRRRAQYRSTVTQAAQAAGLDLSGGDEK